MELDTSYLSVLPRLEILALDGSDKRMESLAILLKDLNKSPALKRVSGLLRCSPEFNFRLYHVCSGRNIRISSYTD